MQIDNIQPDKEFYKIVEQWIATYNKVFLELKKQFTTEEMDAFVFIRMSNILDQAHARYGDDGIKSVVEEIVWIAQNTEIKK